MVGKNLEVIHIRVGESTGLLRTKWKMSLTYSEIVDGDRKVSHVSSS